MHMASETLSASAIVFCICLPINHKNKRQFNFLPLVKYLYFIFRITPTIDIEPKSKNPSSMRTDFLSGLCKKDVFGNFYGSFEPEKINIMVIGGILTKAE